MIPYDLESTPLEIRTNRDFEKKDEFKVSVYGKENSIYGVIGIRWDTYPPRYRFSNCMKVFSNNFLTTLNLPSGSEKVWRITVGKSLDTRSVQIHCNDVEVLNIEMSDRLCGVVSWRDYWMQDREQITFDKQDTVCASYRPYTGNANLKLI